MSRRQQIQMTKSEADQFLLNSRTMILVSNGKDGFPHPMPMWFALDDEGRILMTTFRKSQKTLNLQRDPRVSLLLESGESYAELKSVLIYARAEIIDDEQFTIDTMFHLTVSRGDAQKDQESVIKPRLKRQASKRVVFRFTPEKTVSWDHSKLAGVY